MWWSDLFDNDLISVALPQTISLTIPEDFFQYYNISFKDTLLFLDTCNFYCCSLYWDYAMNVQVDEIVYVHCHQQGK